MPENQFHVKRPGDFALRKMVVRRVLIETPEGRSKETSFQLDTEDIIAIFAGLVALCFTVAIISGSIELNKLSASLVTLSGASIGIAQVVKARKKPDAKKGGWMARALVLAVAVAVAIGAIFFVLK